MRALDARAPTRVDFGGGWTDVPPYSEERGGCVCNLAIALHAIVRLREGAVAAPPGGRASASADGSLLEADTPAAREASLGALLGEQALRKEVAASHLAVSEDRLRQVIGSVGAFQEDGKFSLERYRTLQAAQGMNEAVFEQRVRDDLTRLILLEGVARSAMVPTALTERLAALVEETRTIRERRFRPEDFVAQVNVGDEAIKAYYEANRAQFETKENVDVQVLALTLDDVAGQVSVPAAELQSYYEQNKASFAEPEQRRASEQEFIFYLEKCDINEEKMRLRKHCEYFLETVDTEAPNGKILSFIAQEIGREINTMGSKANDASIQKLVVMMKDELEKIKEQTNNIL